MKKLFAIPITVGILFILVVFISVVASITALVSYKGNEDSQIMIPITVEAVIEGDSVKYTVMYDNVMLNFRGKKRGANLTGEYKNGRGLVPLEVPPSPPANLDTQTIEPCGAITNKSSSAYKVVYGNGSRDDGIYRRRGNRYLVALGSYYSKTMGDEFVIDFIQNDGSTKRISAMIADQKADEHTDPKHQYQKYDKSVIEFITAKGTENRVGETHTQVNRDFGRIKAIYKNDNVNVVLKGKIKGNTVSFTGSIKNIPFYATGTLENNKVVATGMMGDSSLAGNGHFIYPLEKKVPVTSPFGYRIHPKYNTQIFHSGVDLGASHGSHILAASNGSVVLAGYNGGYGNCVIIDHGGGLYTLYGHASRLLVKQGDRVKAGQVIAEVGSTGVSTGSHLHFEVRKNGNSPNNAVDPNGYVKVN